MMIYGVLWGKERTYENIPLRFALSVLCLMLSFSVFAESASIALKFLLTVADKDGFITIGMLWLPDEFVIDWFRVWQLEP